jgi:hypothetical protein
MNSTPLFNLTTIPLQNIVHFRQQIYHCFTKAKDALQNTVDALLTENQAQSLPELSLSPLFHRKWPSLYEAFEDGRIDKDNLRKTFAKNAPINGRKRICIATDASSIARPKSKTARDRTLVYESNLPEGCPPVVAGWQFSTLVLLPESPSSWTYTLDNTRVCSNQKTAFVATEQLKAIVPLLENPTGMPPLLLGDGYYSCLDFLTQTKDIACDKLLRLGKNRVLYRSAPPRTNRKGRPKVHGESFKCGDPNTYGESNDTFEAENLQVSCWHDLHFKEYPHLTVTVIRVVRASAKDTKRDPRVSWFVFVGECFPPLGEIPSLYANRYSIEHGYRVDKQDLLWESVRLRTPEQFERFTHIIACVRNQLCLARSLGSIRQPWERRSGEATPSQVRRSLNAIMWQLGTPADVCRPRGKSVGRLKGAKVTPATRYEVIRKSPQTPKKEAELV